MTKSVSESKAQAKIPQCRYFRSIQLSSIKTFRSETHLDFCFPNGRLAQWTVILGENGTGKTTLLQQLALLRPEQETTAPQKVSDGKKTEYGPPPFRPIGAGPNWFAWHKSNLPRPWKRPMKMKVSLQLSRPSSSLKDANKKIRKVDISDAKNFDRPIDYPYSLEFKTEGEKDVITAKLTVIDQLRFNEQFFLLGYGASRHVAGPTSPYLTSEAFARRINNSSTNTLFHDDQPLISPEQWILGLDHASKSEGKNQQVAQRSLIKAKECLKRILPDISEITISPLSNNSNPTGMAVLFKTPYGVVPFAALSLGCKSMAAWLIDFLRQMHFRYSHLPHPETGPAVVLIDEFDLHMHPKWQLQVMDFLGKQFPNTQFIVTTHSPLIVQAAGGRANLAILRRTACPEGKEEQVIIDNDPARVLGWRLDQIVTSDLYGASSARPRAYQSLFKKRLMLLKKTHLTSKEQIKLNKLTKQLEDEAPPGLSKTTQWAEHRFNQLQRAGESKNAQN